MCGIIGIASHKPVAVELYESLIHLQHRGQDMAGILTFDERLHVKVGRGYAIDVFHQEDIDGLTGNFGVAHLRYPTSGGQTLAEAQPLITTYPYGIGLVHNGNIVNYEELKALLKNVRRYVNGLSDSELLLKYFANCLSEQPYAESSETLFSQICLAVKDIFKSIQGAYSIILAIVGVGLIAFRDPYGIRPLVIGERKTGSHTDYAFASEDIPFYSLGFNRMGDVAPGEVVMVDLQGTLFREVITTQSFRPCMFEYVYFARPDAIINNLSVYRSRRLMGVYLAHAWRKKYAEVLPDVVVPVPSTSNTPALAFANELGVRYSEGLYKNPFIGRTFIMPTQEKRVKSVRTKLHPQIVELKNKKVLLLDDSIVRGTTSTEVVSMVREAGAKEIYLVSTCPPVKFPCYYGIDVPTHDELIANQYESEDEIARALGVDRLLYQSVEDLAKVFRRRVELHHIEHPCMACLDGDYFCGKIE